MLGHRQGSQPLPRRFCLFLPIQAPGHAAPRRCRSDATVEDIEFKRIGLVGPANWRLYEAAVTFSNGEVVGRVPRAAPRREGDVPCRTRGRGKARQAPRRSWIVPWGHRGSACESPLLPSRHWVAPSRFAPLVASAGYCGGDVAGERGAVSARNRRMEPARRGSPMSHSRTPKSSGIPRLKESRRDARIAATRDSASTTRTWRSSPRRATSSSTRFTTSATKCSAWAASGSGLRAASSSISQEG
jgi:hypothetical protein